MSTKRLVPREWAEVEDLYARGDATAQQLADKYGVAISTIRKHLERRGIKSGSKAAQVRDEVAEELADEAAMKARENARRIRSTKDDHYQWSETLAKLAMREIAQAQKSQIPMSSVAGNLKALKAASDIIGNARQERWQILGIDDVLDDDLPELLISEISAEDAQAMANESYVPDDIDDDLGDLDDIEDELDD